MRSTGRRSYLDITQNLYKKIWFFPRKTGIPGGNAGISSDIPARMFFSIIAIRVLPPSNWPVLLSRGFQHMLQQDAVALGGVIHQHMGHSPHKAPVLDDGAAAHPLDDAAGGLQQLGVCDLQ